MMAGNRGRTIPHLPTFRGGWQNMTPTHDGAVRSHTRMRSSRVVMGWGYCTRWLCSYNGVENTRGCFRFAIELNLSTQKEITQQLLPVCVFTAIYPQVVEKFVIQGLQPLELLDQNTDDENYHYTRTRIQIAMA